MREFKPSPALPAPVNSVGPIAWLKSNFFSSIGNSLTTLIILGCLLYVIPGVLDWLFFLRQLYRHHSERLHKRRRLLGIYQRLDAAIDLWQLP